MKKVLIAAVMTAATAMNANAADVYGEVATDRIWNNLDQSQETVGMGIMFHPAKNLTLDIGTKYVFNNDLSSSGHIDTADFNHEEDNQRMYHSQLEDDWLIGISLRYNFFSF